MSDALKELIEILNPTLIAPNTFRGVGSRNDGAPATYGGHFLGQASAAALRTVGDEFNLNSLHAYFVLPGQPLEPIEYAVEVVRDGKGFCTRRVRALQADTVLFELIASFSRTKVGPLVAATPPRDFAELPAPESLQRYSDLMRSLDPLPLPAEWALREHGVDVRLVNAPWTPDGPFEDHGIRMWIRANGELPNDPKLHHAVLAYQSDESLADTLLIPFDVSWSTPGVFCVSLDHSMWFHQPINLNDWYFVEQRPLAVANERGTANAYVWTQQGELAASFTQEALIRIESKS